MPKESALPGWLSTQERAHLLALSLERDLQWKQLATKAPPSQNSNHFLKMHAFLEDAPPHGGIHPPHGGIRPPHEKISIASI